MDLSGRARCRRRCSPPTRRRRPAAVDRATPRSRSTPPTTPAASAPRIQIVTDQSAMLMDTVTVLLHRLGVAYAAIMNPVFRVRRNPAGRAARRTSRPSDPDAPTDGVDETWIHVELSPSADAGAVAEAAALLPSVLADARQVAARLRRAERVAGRSWPARWTPTATATSRPTTAATSPRCCAGWPTATSSCSGYQRCSVRRRRGHRRPGQPAGCAPPAYRRAARSSPSPDDLLVLAQATMPSYLRYGAHPHIVVVRETRRRARPAPIEHRFVGPVHRRRVERQRAGDPAHLAPRRTKRWRCRTATPAIPVS